MALDSNMHSNWAIHLGIGRSNSIEWLEIDGNFNDTDSVGIL